MAPALQIVRLPHAAGSLEYATSGAAGIDLRAAIPGVLSLKPGERARIPIGIKLSIPEGYEGQVRPRSGLADRCGVTVLNSPGTIDSDYRGELQVLLINLGAEEVVLSRGERIAQLVIAPVSRLEIQEVAALGETPRGEQGFGSTGAR